jgi:hypothetical protein
MLQYLKPTGLFKVMFFCFFLILYLFNKDCWQKKVMSGFVDLILNQNVLLFFARISVMIKLNKKKQDKFCI